MDWLNYHHLHYFWVVAKEGTISAACKWLRLAQPTISAQLRSLESSIGEDLFTRKGRTLIARIDSIRERFHAISVECRVSHPAVLAITKVARGKLFD